MAIAFRSKASATVNASAATIVVPVPAGVVDGDVLVLAVTARGSNTTAAVTTPAGWTLRGSQHSGNGATDISVYVFMRVAASEPANYTVTVGSTTRIIGIMSAYTGVDNSTPFDVASVATGGASSSTNVVAASLTTARAGEMLVGAFGVESNSTFTPDAAMTEREDLSVGTLHATELADQLLGAAGATGTRTAVASTTGLWSAVMVALIAAGQPVAPSGIATAEALGSATVTPGAAPVNPTGIAGAEAFGTAVVTGGATPQTVTGAGAIATAEAVGAHTVLRGPAFVLPAGIASAYASGLAVVLTFGGPLKMRFEMALNTGPGGSPVWTDFTDRLLDFDTFRGKNWRLALDEKGTGSFLLRNHDRFLDNLYAGSPYVGTLKIRRRCRLTAVWAAPPAGPETTYTFWTGYARRYRQTLSGGEAAIRLEALGALWLTEDPGLPESALAAELEADAPAAWWPCGGDVDAGMVDRLDRATGRWIRAKAAEASILAFSPGGSRYMARTGSGGLAVAPAVVTAYPSSWFVPIRVDRPVNGDTHGIILQFVDPANPLTTRVQLRLATATDTATHKGKLLARVQNGGQHRCVVDTGVRLDDGLVHTVGVTFVSSSSILLYVDGALVTTTALNSGTPTWPAAATTWTLGNSLDGSPVAGGNSDGLAGYVQDVVVFASDQSARMDDYHDAAVAGWGTSPTTPRATGYMVSKVLDVIGFSAADRTIEAGVTYVQGAPALPDNARALLRRLTLTEDGRLLETKTGGLFFRSRDSYLNAPLDTVVVTFGNNGGAEVFYEEAPPVDPADRIVTRARIGRAGGQVQQSDADQSQIDDYGLIGDGFTDGLHISDAFAAAAAEWRTHYFGDPAIEFEHITIAPGIGDNAQTLQALTRDLDDRVRVIRRPPPDGSAAQDVEETIVAIRHRGSRSSIRTTFSLSAAQADEAWLVIGDATLGKLSNGKLLAY